MSQVQSLSMEELKKNSSFYRYLLVQALYRYIVSVRESYQFIGLFKILVGYFKEIRHCYHSHGWFSYSVFLRWPKTINLYPDKQKR